MTLAQKLTLFKLLNLTLAISAWVIAFLFAETYHNAGFLLIPFALCLFLYVEPIRVIVTQKDLEKLARHVLADIARQTGYAAPLSICLIHEHGHLSYAMKGNGRTLYHTKALREYAQNRDWYRISDKAYATLEPGKCQYHFSGSAHDAIALETYYSDTVRVA